MTEFHTIEGWLKEITYKPGWSFSLCRLPARDDFNLRVLWVVPDSTRPDQMARVNIHRDVPIDGIRTSFELMHVVAAMVRSAEQHEMDEWLRFRGVHVNDPHPV